LLLLLRLVVVVSDDESDGGCGASRQDDRVMDWLMQRTLGCWARRNATGIFETLLRS